MRRDIIAIGGSAGSLDTLREIVRAFPRDFCGNLFIVTHIGRGRSRLPDVLGSATAVPICFAADREPIMAGRIYVAPTDRHMLLEPGRIRLSPGPREHFTRPAIDPLFRSAAIAYRARVIGVVLSGGGSDGAAGLDTIKRAGGVAVVLDPDDATVTEMPEAASEIGNPDYVVSEAQLPSLLFRLSQSSAPDQRSPLSPAEAQLSELAAPPLALTCPECGGALRKSGNGSAARYRCHTGHVFGARELLPAQVDMLERALGVAHRVLNERIEFARQMIVDSRAGGRSHGVQYWQRVRDEAERQDEAIRRVLLRDAAGAGHVSREPGE